MASVYAVKFTTVSELKNPTHFDDAGVPTKFDTQRISGKEGTLNVLAQSPTDAGDIATAHLKKDGVVEVNIHLVHELAKGVITALDVQLAKASLVGAGVSAALAGSQEPDIATQLHYTTRLIR